MRYAAPVLEASVIETMVPGFDRQRFQRNVSRRALDQAIRFENVGVRDAVRANMRFWFETNALRNLCG